MSNFYRGSSIDASYHVSVHLAERFQGRRLKCEKLMDNRRRTPIDGKSSHCLWQGELKIGSSHPPQYNPWTVLLWIKKTQPYITWTLCLGFINCELFSFCQVYNHFFLKILKQMQGYLETNANPTATLTQKQKDMKRKMGMALNVMKLLDKFL